MLKKILKNPLWGERLADGLARYVNYVRSKGITICEPENPDELFNKEDPFILSVWHGQFLLIPTIRPDEIKAKIVVGSHGDAELAAKLVSRFGVTPIRGSGAAGRRSKRDRGGAKVLKQSIKALKEGYCIVSTADVPPGPAQKVGEGIITMARLSGRPIIPAAIATKKAITFKSWSRLTINLPSKKTGFVVGDPIHVPRDCTAEELEKYRLELEEAMGKATKRAHELAERSPEKIMPLWERSLKPGIALNAYKVATSLAKPIAPLIFKYRVNKDKEIPERENERYGISNLKRPSGTLWWFHAASVGETFACLPLIEKLLKRNPDLSVMLTTGTITSAKLAEKKLPERAFHQFIPLDNKLFVKRFLAHWRPNLAAFVESEIWPNLILETHAKNIPLVLINGRMSKKSFKRWFKKPAMARPLFGRFDKVLAQGPIDERRFITLGAEKVIHSGNLKIDAPALTFDQTELENLKKAIDDRPILVAASTHANEEEVIAEAHKIIALDYPDFLTIIVPRHPHRAEEIKSNINQIQSSSRTPLNVELRSQSKTPSRTTNIYIADTMGEMGLFYSLTKTAFIGGSFIPHGGQNPIEALKLGTNIITGPHVENFNIAYFELFQRGGAIQVEDANALATQTVNLLKNPEQHKNLDQGSKAAIEYLSGAEEITLNALETYLDQNKS